jgi:hypothetical protein
MWVRRIASGVVVAVGMMPAVASGAGWSLVPGANAPAPRGHLSGVSCASAGACIAVGHHKNGAGTQVALAERWNGTSWAIQTTPNPPGARTSSLLGVACVSADACTAVGDYVNGDGTQVTLAERWNGRRWAIQATPNPPGAHAYYRAYMNGVSCVSVSACTAVGNYNSYVGGSVPTLTLAEVWNGTSWAIQATPNPGSSVNELFGVSCVSTGACTAVGDYVSGGGIRVMLAERWDGTSWAIQATPNAPGAHAYNLNGVSCVSTAGCTAVGDYENSAGNEVALAERWDGTGWAIQPTPNPHGAQHRYESGFQGVSCVSAGRCTAVGGYTNRAGTFVTLAERWNGTDWAIQNTPKPTGAHSRVLYGVSRVSAGRCTAVGAYYNFAGTTEVTLTERWNERSSRSLIAG